MPFDAKLPLPGSALFEVHAAAREDLRAKLRDSAPFMTRLLLPKSSEPPWERIFCRELYVRRQLDARNPDTLLMQRLLANQRECIEFVTTQPGLLTACQSIERALNDPSFKQKTFTQAEYDSFVIHHLSVHRLEQALSLANSIWTARLRFVPSVHLAIAALELRQLLEPENPEVKQLDEIREVVKRYAAKNSEVYFDRRIDAGYSFLPDVDRRRVTFAVHQEGALSIEIPGKETNEIDLARLTKGDATCFPDPLLPAKLLEQDLGIPSCRYTDQKSRQRAIIYDDENDDFALHE